jgi:hypothetical protein
VYCDVDMLIVDVLDERVASSEYRYSAGNAMGIVVVVDREEVKCCATARSRAMGVLGNSGGIRRTDYA